MPGTNRPKSLAQFDPIYPLLNHLYTDRPIAGCQSTQTNKKKPLYLRGKKGLFSASLLNVVCRYSLFTLSF